jgi:DNA-binding SARP family transcriptional activator
VLNHSHAHPREALATLLWADSPTAQARKSLRHTLWQLQTSLEAADPTVAALLQVEPEWVQLRVSDEIWVDALSFDQAYRDTRGMPGDTLGHEAAAKLRSAAELYQSDLLDGWYQEWCLYERERFQSMYLAMLDKLMRYCKANGEHEIGMDFGARILRHDRSHEQTYRQLMQLHYLAGDRAGALRQFERCGAALREELGVKPSQRTIALYERIRDERPLTGTPEQPAAEAASVPLPQILGELKQLWETLIAAQQQLQQHIQIVERAMREHRQQ